MSKQNIANKSLYFREHN